MWSAQQENALRGLRTWATIASTSTNARKSHAMSTPPARTRQGLTRASATQDFLAMASAAANARLASFKVTRAWQTAYLVNLERAQGEQAWPHATTAPLATTSPTAERAHVSNAHRETFRHIHHPLLALLATLVTAKALLAPCLVSPATWARFRRLREWPLAVRVRRELSRQVSRVHLATNVP